MPCERRRTNAACALPTPPILFCAAVVGRPLRPRGFAADAVGAGRRWRTLSAVLLLPIEEGRTIRTPVADGRRPLASANTLAPLGFGMGDWGWRFHALPQVRAMPIEGLDDASARVGAMTIARDTEVATIASSGTATADQAGVSCQTNSD